MPTISLRLSNRDYELIKEYARLKNVSVSALLRDAVIERIEGDLDTGLFNKAFLVSTHHVDELVHKRQRLTEYQAGSPIADRPRRKRPD